jgi:hypothetical protein
LDVRADAGRLNVVQVREVTAFILKVVNRGPHQRGLSGASFADKQCQPAAARQSILQIAERFAVPAGQQQEPRVRRQIERTFAKTKKRFVH